MPNAAVALVPTADTRRCVVTIHGVVQGIGIRPLIYRLAVGRALTGDVRNTRGGVAVDVEGPESALRAFVADVTSAIPHAHVAARWSAARGASPAFVIAPSQCDGVATLALAPDLATCEACRRDLADPGDRRHGYAFTTCASCGPRFSIVDALPWDRRRTAMAGFTVCARCRREYESPRDRRFHAETIACPECGPRLTIHRPDGATVVDAAAIDIVASMLRAGAVVAIKGIGGYHLACDATDRAAVASLRQGKRRDAKPLAVMVGDLEAARSLCAVSDAEAALLTSPARPIVLLERREGTAIADDVAPAIRRLGVMLPYTPLHHLLLEAVGRPLVMTSGNASDEPIAYRDDDARGRLRGVADGVVTHDRPIRTPCDDSVAQVVHDVPRLIRRSRGYVPGAIRLPIAAPRAILACGGELKSCVALVREGEAFVSQHLGDLTSEAAYRGFLAAIEHFRSLLALDPHVVAHDLHPAYRSTLYAQSLRGLPRIAVQHHHAHVASCLADNGVDRRVIGVAWDGAGYGVDGTVWGGEFLIADLGGFTRAGHLEPVPLPGGDAAVREPWRMAAAFLRTAYGGAMEQLDLAFVRGLDGAAWRVLDRAIASGVNAPSTSSAGRLFDAVASLVGLRRHVSFEGQAAMELEALAQREADRIYPVRIAEDDGPLVIRTTDIIRGVVEDLLADVRPALIAARFHGTLVDALTRTCCRLRERTAIQAVALSGGVFQNAWLLEAAIDALEASGFEVYTHRRVPTNDGGLALGQAAVAARQLVDGGA